MSVQVFNSILPFSINRFMELFPDGCALLFCSCMVSIDIRNEDREHLSRISQLNRGFACGARGVHHDDCVAQAHLRSAHRIAVAVVFGEAENSCEPLAGLRHIAIDNMGQHCIAGHRTVLHGNSMQWVRGRLRDSCYSRDSMPRESSGRRRLTPLWRAVIEVAFIIFLFYSNLLMGEFTGSNGKGKSLAFALHDIFTGTNLAIAMVSALIGYAVFETLRKKL